MSVPFNANDTAIFTNPILIGQQSSPSFLPSITQAAGSNVSTALEIQSTTGTLLISRMTTAQYTAPTFNPTNGMIVYDTTLDAFKAYQAGAWVSFVDIPVPISLANGGTGASLVASNGGIFYSTAATGAILAGTATALQILQSGANTAPTWSTATYPATTTINQLLYSSAANVISGVAVVNSAGLTTSAGGVPTWVAYTGTGAPVLANTPTLVTPLLGTPTSGTLTNCTGLPISTGVSGLGAGVAAGLANAATGTGSPVLATSPTLVTPNLDTPSVGVLTNCTGLPLTTGVTGILPFANGGTNVSSVTTTPTATSFAGWDANKNLSANNFLGGYATIATSGGTTTLTVASAANQYFTGSTTQTVVLPVASTLVLGQTYYIVNLSVNSNITVQSSGGNTVLVLVGGSDGSESSAYFTCVVTSGTGAASWYAFYNSSTRGQGLTAIYVNSGTTFQMANNARYVPDIGGLMTFTLPSSARFGDVVAVLGKGGSWKIAQNGGQKIVIGSSSTTVGAGGSIASTNSSDSVRLVCISDSAIWSTEGAPQGNLTIV